MAKNWRKTDGGDSLAKGLRGTGTDLLFGSDGGLRETVVLRVTDIVPNPDQPRRFFDPDELARLAESLSTVGQLCPVLARRHPEERRRYLLIAGERRWRAAQLAGLATLNAHILPDTIDDDQIALIENLQRVNLSPVEEADGIQRLIVRHGYSQEEAGGLLGRGRTEITTTLTLLRLVPEIRTACVTSHNQIPKAVLLEVAKMPPEEQKRVWPQVEAGGLTARAAREARQGGGGRGRDVSVAATRSPNRFLAGLPRLRSNLDAGLRALADAPPPPESHVELRALRASLDEYAALLDRILDAPGDRTGG